MLPPGNVRRGLPTEEERRNCLVALLTDFPEHLGSLEAWVRDTRGLELAHLRDLAASVCALGAAYDDTLRRLRSGLDELRSGE